MLIDTHSHLYLSDFKDDFNEVVNRCLKNEVLKVVLPNIDKDSIDDMHSLSDNYPSIFYPLMGVHPCSVSEKRKSELVIAEKWLSERKYFGIGEVGLDYYWDKTEIPLQQKAFQIQINWAKSLSLPIIIHSRDAMWDCIKMIKENQDGNLKGIFHCFSGSEEEALQITEMGFHLGIGGVATYKTCRLSGFLKNIDRKWIVLETDSPYLTPVPLRGKRNESSYVKIIAEKVAEFYETSYEEVAEFTSKNALELFRF